MRKQIIENIKAKNKAQQKKSSSLLTQSNVKGLPLSQERFKLKMNRFEIDDRSGVFFDNLILVEELAVVFRLAPQTIRNWVALGKIPYVKLGRRHFFQQGSVQEWLNQKEIPLWQ